MMVVLPIFRSCYTLKVQFMSLLISLGILPTLKEQDIGAEFCHIDLGGGKGIATLKTLKFPLCRIRKSFTWCRYTSVLYSRNFYIRRSYK